MSQTHPVFVPRAGVESVKIKEIDYNFIFFKILRNSLIISKLGSFERKSSFCAISLTFVFGGENVGKIFGGVKNSLYLCTQKS